MLHLFNRHSQGKVGNGFFIQEIFHLSVQWAFHLNRKP